MKKSKREIRAAALAEAHAWDNFSNDPDYLEYERDHYGYDPDEHLAAGLLGIHGAPRFGSFQDEREARKAFARVLVREGAINRRLRLALAALFDPDGSPDTPFRKRDPAWEEEATMRMFSRE